jgi:hypothetical protein
VQGSDRANGTDRSGGRDRVRTCDLVVANDALSQLSYTPTNSNILILAEDFGLSNQGNQALVGRAMQKL